MLSATDELRTDDQYIYLNRYTRVQFEQSSFNDRYQFGAANSLIYLVTQPIPVELPTLCGVCSSSQRDAAEFHRLRPMLRLAST